MPIFSNRTLAAMVADLPRDIRAACLADIQGRLESGAYTALAAEWELLVLRQLAVKERLKLAPKTSGVRLPDAIFEASNGERAVVEVTTLSDEELENRFPIDSLGMLFYSRLKKLRTEHLGSFNVATIAEVRANGLPNLALPERKDMHKFMSSKEVKSFISAIAQAPTETRFFEYVVGASKTTVTFKPGAEFSYSSAAGYSARGYNDHNNGRLLKKLGKKVSQISASRLALPGIVVLCDADCRMLRDTKRASWEKEGTFESIAQYIQGRPEVRYGAHGPWVQRGVPQQTTSLNAVLVLSIEETPYSQSQPIRRRLTGKLLENSANVKFSLSRESVDEFLHCFDQVPRIQRTPMNAKHISPYSDNTGGGSMSGNRIRLSLLCVQDLLAGKLSVEQFVAQNDFLAKQIRREVDMGRCISAATVVPSTDDEDDDWIEFDFSGIDPRNLVHLLDSGE